MSNETKLDKTRTALSVILVWWVRGYRLSPLCVVRLWQGGFCSLKVRAALSVLLLCTIANSANNVQQCRNLWLTQYHFTGVQPLVKRNAWDVRMIGFGAKYYTATVKPYFWNLASSCIDLTQHCASCNTVATLGQYG